MRPQIPDRKRAAMEIERGVGCLVVGLPEVAHPDELLLGELRGKCHRETSTSSSSQVTNGSLQESCIHTHCAWTRWAASRFALSFEAMLAIQQIATPQLCGTDMPRMRSMDMWSPPGPAG